MERNTAGLDMDAEQHGIRPPGYRLPESTRIGVVRLQVSDLARSLAYYERVIGLRELRRKDGAAILGPTNGEQPIVELHELPGARSVPRRGRLGLYHYAILVPDRASLGRFVAHLSAIGAYAGMSDHGGEAWNGMPNGTVFGHVHLLVGDLQRAERFYHDALGLDKVVWGYPGALFLSAGGYHHHLGTNTWASGATPAEDDEARLLEWEMILPDAEDVSHLASSVEQAGYTVERSSAGTIRTRDPWGTAVRILPETGRSKAP